MTRYVIDEVISTEHVLGEKLTIVRARHLGMELFILEVLSRDGAGVKARPFMSLHGAQQAKAKYLRERVELYGV